MDALYCPQLAHCAAPITGYGRANYTNVEPGYRMGHDDGELEDTQRSKASEEAPPLPR